MAAGTPLTDADRWPWLDRLAAEMAAIDARGGNAVLACSALKQAYRDRLSRAGDVRFVHLTGDHDTIAARLAARKHHYMPATLLASQFATLEAPTDAIVVDIRDADRRRRSRRSAPRWHRHLETHERRRARSRPRARCISAAIPRKFLGAVNTPVFRASTMLFPTVADLEQAARGEYEGIGYGLHGLPTVTDLQDAVAAIEGGARGARGAVGPHRDDVAAARAR